jgi:cullin 1
MPPVVPTRRAGEGGGAPQYEGEAELLVWVTDRCQTGDTIELEEGWDKITQYGTSTLEGVLTGSTEASAPFGRRGYSSLYTVSYRMCSQPAAKDWSEQLYNRHAETISDYLNRIVLPALQGKHDEFLLREFIKHWENHKLMTKWMWKLFMHLDKAYVMNGSLPTLTSAGLRLFKTIVYDGSRTDLMTTMLAVINRERSGEDVDDGLLKTTTQVFEAMGTTQSHTQLKNLEAALKIEAPDLSVYTNDFEDFLLTNSQEYYAHRSQEWLESDGTPQFLEKAEAALNSETSRVARYLNRTSEGKILAVVEQEILQRHQTALLEKEGSGCMWLLCNDRLTDLERMFRLFKRIDGGLVPMAKFFKEHVVNQGKEIVSTRKALVEALKEEKPPKKENPADPEFVEALLALHEKYMSIVDNQFGQEHLFQKALKDAFIVFMNQDASPKVSNTEMVSTYCDRILKGGKKLSDIEIEAYLCNLLQLFNYLQDKDLYAEIYRNQLSKRLLNKRSVSNDAEKSMIGKLKMQCGAPFTSKLEGMVTDYNMCDENTKKFQDWKKGKSGGAGGGPEVDFSVQVLTTGFWPTYKILDVTLPREMSHCTGQFKDWYDSVHTKRRLKWIHAIGEATMQGKFKTSHTMVVSTLQAIALMFFNPGSGNGANGVITFAEVQQGLNLEAEIVKRLMHSLTCGKFKVLTKDPSASVSKSIKETDSFSVNADFKERLKKFRIPMASLEDSHNPERVSEDRSFAVDAAIVRIMKARKVLSHQMMVSEVLTQLHFFRPQPKLIKKRIEQLIEREYLERDPDDQKSYKYIA